MPHGGFIPLSILFRVAYFEFVQIHELALIWPFFCWMYSDFFMTINDILIFLMFLV